MVSGFKEGIDRKLSCFVLLGLLGITSSLKTRAELSEDKESACFRSLGGYRSAKSAAVERTGEDTTGRERCENSACV